MCAKKNLSAKDLSEKFGFKISEKDLEPEVDKDCGFLNRMADLSGLVDEPEKPAKASKEEKPAEPKSHWCTPPFYFFTREDSGLVAKGIREGCGVDAPGSFLAWLCGQMPVHAMEMPGRRYDIGNLQSYQEVCRTYRGIR